MRDILFLLGLGIAIIVVVVVLVIGVTQLDSMLAEHACNQYAMINSDQNIQYFRGSLLSPLGCMIKVNGTWVSTENVYGTIDGDIYFGDKR